MNAHEEYFQAVIPTPKTVLGLALKPFSAGHIIQLHRIQSVFVKGGQVTRAELEAAVFICAQSFQDSDASRRDRSTNEFTADWIKQLGDYDLAEKVAEFNDYLTHGCSFPLIYAPRNDTREISVTNLPGVHTVRCAIKHYYHVSDAEFWDMPWSLAQWDYFTIPVMEGRGDLVEQDSLTAARDFAEADFRRANPQLYNPDGSRKEGAWQN